MKQINFHNTLLEFYQVITSKLFSVENISDSNISFNLKTF